MEVEVRIFYKNRYGLQLEVWMINAWRNNKFLDQPRVSCIVHPLPDAQWPGWRCRTQLFTV